MSYAICVERDFSPIESSLMHMTLMAHKEVLYEKIKEQIQKQEGAKLETIAALLVEASQARWKAQHELDRNEDELGDKLRDAWDQ